MIALCDVNNFYVSCERVFSPALNNQPVVVLSNNDGCVISRSNSVKAMGIKTGDPVFKVKSIFNKNRVQSFSSNYALYGDMSRRISDLIHRYSDQVENYSIDESFIGFDGFDHVDLFKHCKNMVADIWQCLGLPVSVGLSHTKTLAKVAALCAKKSPNGHRVYVLESNKDIKKALFDLPVAKIWGVGKRSAERLNLLGIETAWELRNADMKQLRKHFSVVMERTIMELKGVSCIEINGLKEARKQIICTRSFAQSLNSLQPIREAVAYHVSRACVLLREQKSMAQSITVGLTSSYKNVEYRQDSQGITMRLPTPSQDTSDFLRLASNALKRVYQPNVAYRKAGIMLNELSDLNAVQVDMFEKPTHKKKQLMDIFDAVNSRYGKGSIRSAQEGFGKHWHMKSEKKSQAYTTDINQLIRVH